MRVSKDLAFLDFKKYEYVSNLLKEISDSVDNSGGVRVQTCRNLHDKICAFENLHLAFKRAKKGKKLNPKIARFQTNLESELLQLKHELETMTYQPRPIKQFVVRDPKTRLISASDFRDRVVHHALCNVIETIFDKMFISDSYANRKSKGTLAAVLKFDKYKRKISGNGKLLTNAKDNNTVYGYVFKADIRHYFDSVDHEVLMQIISRKIRDEKVISLIKKIIDNHCVKGKGMPIGNLTSQFFANVYLNELDYFVKHKLKVKYYIRYVDDFVILHESKETLEFYKVQVSEFLETIKLELHPQKSKIVPLHKGVSLLGLRVFYKYKLLKRSNVRRIPYRLQHFAELYAEGIMDKEKIFENVEGWNAYAMHGNTYKFRKSMAKTLHKSLKRIDKQNAIISTQN